MDNRIHMLITTDQHHRDVLGCYGATVVEPRLDLGREKSAETRVNKRHSVQAPKRRG